MVLSFLPKNAVQPFSLPSVTQHNGIGYLVHLSPGGQAMVFSTFFGGSTLDSVFGVVVDSGGNMFITGYTQSNDMPIKQAYQGNLRRNR
jgi:hypothetical protein